MKSASIVIIRSVWEEPFGLVVAEAMSSGACIIVSKFAGITKIIKDNEILMDNTNHKKLLKIENLIEDKKMRQNYQKKAWKNFEFSSNISSNKLDDFR